MPYSRVMVAATASGLGLYACAALSMPCRVLQLELVPLLKPAPGMHACMQLSALELDREEADRMAREMVVKHQKLSAENQVRLACTALVRALSSTLRQEPVRCVLPMQRSVHGMWPFRRC